METLDVSRETQDRLEAFAQLLRAESLRQNLISKSTFDSLWTRHIEDSAQLYRFAQPGARWVDIGTGAGLPGIVLAILGADITLVEPRKLRVDFLRRALSELRINSSVIPAKAEGIRDKFDVITGRAVASLDKFLGIAAHLSHPGSLWVLPKGRTAKSELVEAQRSWHYDLRSQPSITDPDAEILLLSNVRVKQRP